MGGDGRWVGGGCDDGIRGAATGVAAFQKLKGLRCLDEDLNLQPSIQAG